LTSWGRGAIHCAEAKFGRFARQIHVQVDNGYALPIGLESGEANWFAAQPFGGTGRLLQSNPAEYAARSFNCGEYSPIVGGIWYPDGWRTLSFRLNRLTIQGAPSFAFFMAEGGQARTLLFSSGVELLRRDAAGSLSAMRLLPFVTFSRYRRQPLLGISRLRFVLSHPSRDKTARRIGTPDARGMKMKGG
jgi:hypothetical protein